MSAIITPPRATSIRQTALELLREALLSGGYPPGYPLTENAISAQLGISRGPVREALLILAQEGLVAHHPNHGFSVVNWDTEDGPAMAAVRLPLETMALELARKNVTADQLKDLDRIKIRILAGVRSQQVAQWIREDLRFHEQIWEWSGNEWLALALRRITYPFFAYSLMYQDRRTPATLETMEYLHDAYVKYLRGEGERTAEQCVRLHLDRYSIP